MSKIAIDAEIMKAYLQIVLSEIEADELTSYGVAVVLNKILVANGKEKVRPQMMYNYARNGLIVKGEKISGQSLRNFKPLEVAEFIVRYCVRNDVEIKFVIPANENQLELDLESVTE